MIRAPRSPLAVPACPEGTTLRSASTFAHLRSARAAGTALALVLVCTLALTWAFATSAHAAFGVAAFTGEVAQTDGSPATQAGAHPADAKVNIDFNTHVGPTFGLTVPDADVRNVTVDLPPGFIGNPQSVPRCDEDTLQNSLGLTCPADTQVGISLTNISFWGDFYSKIYNMVPPPGQPAQFAMQLAGVVVHLNARVRSDGDYGVSIDASDLSQKVGANYSHITFWGVPADPSHDGLRGDCVGADGPRGITCPSAAVAKPFLTNPTLCDGNLLTTTLHTSSWEDATNIVTKSFDHDVNGVAMKVDGCDRVPFDGSFTVKPVLRVAGAPSAYQFDLHLPQDDNPSGVATSTVRKVAVTLPRGVTVSPSSADGLQGCTDAQFGEKRLGAPACPAGSTIGSVRIDTPLLDAPLDGDVILGEPKPDQLLRLFLVAEGQGVRVKLSGIVTPDPETGQLTATFDNNPQLPFSDLHLELKGGSRAPLSNPPTTGTYTTNAELTSWSGKSVTSVSTFTIDQGPATLGFAPGFDAGSVSSAAGASSPFTLALHRDDTMQTFKALDVTLPEGVLGTVGAVPLCPEVAAASGTCGAESQVGRVVVTAGAGTSPLNVPQAGKAPTGVYLAGPYKGAPFSLSIVVPAQAGPFDLGNVAVRAALFVDPIDAHVTVKSDPIPSILKGIPLQVRSMNVIVDRAGFMRNPTNCSPKVIGGVVTSTQDAIANVSSRFQAANCSALALKPTLGLSLSGKGQTTDGKHPAVTAALTQPAGQGNLKKVRVALPLSLALDPDNANGLCEFADGSKAEPTCPKASIVGSATAVTPILNEPLSGPVYFVKNIRKDPKSGREIRTLPKLVIPLVGQNGVKLTLTGTSDVVDDQLVTTFNNIPDAPVSSFKLSIIGGKGGILTVSGADICKATQVADQQIDGQNNKAADTEVSIQTPSCPLKVLSKTVGKTAVAIKVGGLGAGKVTVTGRGIKKTSKTISKSTVATISAKRSKGKPGKVTVSFVAAGSKKASKTTK
jgi:hypothetical protein